MKRIAYVINTIAKGGPGNVVLNLINGIDFKRYDPVLITLFRGNDVEVVRNLRSDGIKVIECLNDNRMEYLINGHKEYREIIKREHIDIIHSHGFVPDIMTAGITFGGKKVTTIHNIMSVDYEYEYGVVRGKIFAAVHFFALRKFDVVVGCSRTVSLEMKKVIPECRYVRNGIAKPDIGNMVSRKEIGIQDNAIVFIYVGRLSARKNVINLVRNFKKYHSKNEYLLMLGDGPDLKRCKDIADDYVFFLGFRNIPLEYMNIADIYISASRAEGFSISILEALSCGLGVFLSDIPSHREVFEISKDVYLGEYFMETDFGKKLELLRKNLFQIDKNKIANFQKKKLSIRAMGKKYQEFYG